MGTASGRSSSAWSCRWPPRVIVGGFRIALLQVIATATIGAFLSGGGLGRFIIDGIARRDDGMLYAGVLLVAGLAIGTDLVLSRLQRRLTPQGVRLATGVGPAAAEVVAGER